MEKPTVHLNGTSREALAGGYERASAAIGAAISALIDCTPHGRDYYPNGEGSIGRALKEHARRVEMLTGVLDEVHELHEHVCSETKGKPR